MLHQYSRCLSFGRMKPFFACLIGLVSVCADVRAGSASLRDVGEEWRQFPILKGSEPETVAVPNLLTNNCDRLAGAKLRHDATPERVAHTGYRAIVAVFDKNSMRHLDTIPAGQWRIVAFDEGFHGGIKPQDIGAGQPGRPVLSFPQGNPLKISSGFGVSGAVESQGIGAVFREALRLNSPCWIHGGTRRVYIRLGMRSGTTFGAVLAQIPVFRRSEIEVLRRSERHFAWRAVSAIGRAAILSEPSEPDLAGLESRIGLVSSRGYSLFNSHRSAFPAKPHDARMASHLAPTVGGESTHIKFPVSLPFVALSPVADRIPRVFRHWVFKSAHHRMRNVPWAWLEVSQRRFHHCNLSLQNLVDTLRTEDIQSPWINGDLGRGVGDLDGNSAAQCIEGARGRNRCRGAADQSEEKASAHLSVARFRVVLGSEVLFATGTNQHRAGVSNPRILFASFNVGQHSSTEECEYYQDKQHKLPLNANGGSRNRKVLRGEVDRYEVRDCTAVAQNRQSTLFCHRAGGSNPRILSQSKDFLRVGWALGGGFCADLRAAGSHEQLLQFGIVGSFFARNKILFYDCRSLQNIVNRAASKVSPITFAGLAHARILSQYTMNEVYQNKGGLHA